MTDESPERAFYREKKTIESNECCIDFIWLHLLRKVHSLYFASLKSNHNEVSFLDILHLYNRSYRLKIHLIEIRFIAFYPLSSII